MKVVLSFLLLSLITLPVWAKKTILIVGDSISAGYGMNIEQSWPTLLQKKILADGNDYRVVNDSISGDTTSNGLERLPKILAETKPAITILELGGNDGLRGLQPATIKNNLNKMIALCKKAGSKVLILGLRIPPNFGPDYTQAFQAIYADFAKQSDVTTIPLLLNTIDDKPELMQEDQIHPRPEAQLIILENVWPVLRKML